MYMYVFHVYVCLAIGIVFHFSSNVHHNSSSTIFSSLVILLLSLRFFPSLFLVFTYDIQSCKTRNERSISTRLIFFCSLHSFLLFCSW